MKNEKSYAKWLVGSSAVLSEKNKCRKMCIIWCHLGKKKKTTTQLKKLSMSTCVYKISVFSWFWNAYFFYTVTSLKWGSILESLSATWQAFIALSFSQTCTLKHVQSHAMGVGGFKEHLLLRQQWSTITSNTVSLMLLMAHRTAVHGNTKTPMSVNWKAIQIVKLWLWRNFRNSLPNLFHLQFSFMCTKE